MGYNPSHLNGGGDLIESITQAFNSPVSSYDLDTMLMQMYPEVTTRKILLVGHSQGGFYVNELYDYLTRHGVPKQSIAVYAVATPASYVAGGGEYITSSNDKVINAVREKEAHINVRAYADSYYMYQGSLIATALRPNITLSKEANWNTNPYGGHGFEDAYLASAAPRIAADITYELSTLSAPQPEGDTGSGCFIPPSPGLAYQAQKALFSLVDPLAASTGGAALKSVGESIIRGPSGLLAGGLKGLADIISNSLTNEITAQGQTADAAAALQSVADTARAAVSTPPEPQAPDISPAVANAQTPPPSASAAQHEMAQPAAPAQALPAPVPAPAPAPALVAPPSTVTQPLFAVTPGFGGAGGPALPAPALSAPVIPAVSLAVDMPQEAAAFATTSITFSGSSDGGALISASVDSQTASTTASDSGEWQLALTLPEGEHAVSFRGDDGAGIKPSGSASRTITVDLTPPEPPEISVPACADSIASFGCVLPVSQTAVAWQAVAGASAYALVTDGVAGAPSGSTTRLAELAENATTTIQAVAYDAAGNAATSSAREVAAVSRPLIITEVGWGGTGPNPQGGTSDPSTQWLELRNLEPFRLDLSKFSLHTSGGLDLPLSGTMDASTTYYQSYWIVDSAPIRALPGGSLYETTIPSLALSASSPEQLSLAWDEASVDQTPPADSCGGTWCAGSAIAPLGGSVFGYVLDTALSMERNSQTADGTLAASWHTADSYGPFINGRGALWGTPLQDNSQGLSDAFAACGTSWQDLSNVAVAHQNYTPGAACSFFSRFITYGAWREYGIYEGDIGSSTLVRGNLGYIGLDSQQRFDVPDGTPAGTHFFFTIDEIRNPDDVQWTGKAFYDYYTGASSTPPHGNYVTIPWVYQP